MKALRFLPVIVKFLWLLPLTSQAADIYKCKDIKTGRTVFSNSLCDAKTQRLVSVLIQEDLEKRNSTFNGAALRQQAASIKTQPAQQVVQSEPRYYESNGTQVMPGQPQRDKSRCISLNREKDNIDTSMRRGYSIRQGESYRQRLRDISDQLTLNQCSGFDR